MPAGGGEKMAPLGELSEGFSDSGSEDSSLSDSEVSPEPVPWGGLAPAPLLAPLLTLFPFSPQLQEAFAKGALKPGLNVVLEARPKKPNDVVSVLAGELVKETFRLDLGF